MRVPCLGVEKTPRGCGDITTVCMLSVQCCSMLKAEMYVTALWYLHATLYLKEAFIPACKPCFYIG